MVSDCEQTVKSKPDRVGAVPLRMLQVPRPELNRCTTRDVQRKDQQQNPSETSDRRKARILGGFHEASIPADRCIGSAGDVWVCADSRRRQQHGLGHPYRLLKWL